MTSAAHDQDQDPAAGSPGDVPAGRPATLDRLDALTGEWQTEATFEAGFFGPGSPPVTGLGRTTFEWLPGRFFLIQRFGAEHPDAPAGIAIIGAAQDHEAFTQHYYDSRGVSRVYQMSFDGRAWKLWREAPGFWQRYTGVLAEDGTTVTGAWEASKDGRDWRHDFRFTYTRTR